MHLILDKAFAIVNSVLISLHNGLHNFISGFTSTLSGYALNTTKQYVFSLYLALTERLHRQPQTFTDIKWLNETRAWRIGKASHWSISNIDWDVTLHLREYDYDFVGIANEGATCYINSVIQQLFMLKRFRFSILKLNEELKGVLFGFHDVFLMLYGKLRSIHISNKFFQAMNIDTQVQRDASEFLIDLIDQLNNSLKNTSEPTLMKDTFEFRTDTSLKCSKCGNIKIVSETHYMLELEVKGKRSLIEGLNALISKEVLHGDNAYLCDTCKTTEEAVKREYLKSLPNVLMIHLKRFEQFNKLESRKINTYYEFPREINFSQYTSIIQGKYDASYDEYFQYKLKGIVIHSGTVNAGHYYSIIRKDNERERWIKFNDWIVSDFDITRLKEEAFGNDSEENLQFSNAYILIYQRKNVLEKPVLAIYEGGNIDKSALQVARQEANQKDLIQENIQINDEAIECTKKQLLLNKEYANFIMRYCKDPMSSNFEKRDAVAINYLLTVLMRSANIDEETFEFVEMIEEWCKNDTKVALEFVKLFCNKSLLCEFFACCKEAKVRRCIAELLKSSIDSVHSIEKDRIDAYLTAMPSDIPYLIYLANNLLMQLENKYMNHEYFEIITHCVKLNVFKYLVNSKLITVLLDYMNPSESRCNTVMQGLKQEFNEPTIIPPPIDCNATDELTTVQKLYCNWSVYELLSVVIRQCLKHKMYPEDLEKLKVFITPAMLPSLFKLTCESDSIPNFIKALCEIKEEYTKEVINVMYQELESCNYEKSWNCLNTIYSLLQLENPAVQKKLLDVIFEMIEKELAMSGSISYAYMHSYIDFLLNTFVNKKIPRVILEEKFSEAKVVDLMERIDSWITGNTYPEVNTKLFKEAPANCTLAHLLNAELSKQANVDRKTLLNMIKQRDYSFEIESIDTNLIKVSDVIRYK